ncbi:MAG TPA: hypothetical protein VF733_04985 [Candidatus Saccharimonadales bacterium]
MNKTGRNKERLQAELLFRELQRFRKGQGLVHWKLKEATYLKKVVAIHLGLPEKELSAGQLYSYLLYEIEKLGQGPATEALRHAFAINRRDAPRTLTDRREDLALHMGRHPDTVKAYENQAIKELAYRLGRADIRTPQSRVAAAPIERATPDHLRALKNAATESITGLYALGENGSKILQTLGRSRQPFLDVDYSCSLSPSERGSEWYKFSFEYRFKTAKTTFRMGACASPLDTSTLMASGVVDDIIQFDDSADLSSEVLLEGWHLVAHDTQQGTSKVLAFSEVSKQERKNLLDGVWQLDPDKCRILEVTVPDVFRHDAVTYEIRATMQLDINGHYAFWEAPSLMYLNTITIDLSNFGDDAKGGLQCSVKPFLGNLFPTVVESERHVFHLSVNSWITSGHGVAIIWR